MARRKIDEVVKAAAIEEMREDVPRKDISVKYGIAQSTLSRWAQEAGLEPHHLSATKAHKASKDAVRSKPLNVAPVENSSEDASAERREMIRRMVSLVNELAADGGLKSHDIKNLSQAAKTLSEADQREQRILQEEQERAKKTKEEGALYDIGMGDIRVRAGTDVGNVLLDLEGQMEDPDAYWERRWAQQKEEYDVLRAEGIEQPWRKPQSEKEELERGRARARQVLNRAWL